MSGRALGGQAGGPAAGGSAVAGSAPPVLARTKAELAHARAGLDTRNGPVVLVPTMGALHTGHERLLGAARTLAGPRGSVVVSIFRAFLL